MDLFETIANDHRLIEHVLSSFERFLSRSEASRALNLVELNRFCVFFRDFVELVHHEREEKALFPAMERIGYAPDTGPLGQLRAKHRHGRSLLLELRRAAVALREPADLARARLVKAARELIAFEREHMKQEGELMGPAIRNGLALATPPWNPAAPRNGKDPEHRAAEEAWLRELATALIHEHPATRAASLP